MRIANVRAHVLEAALGAFRVVLQRDDVRGTCLVEIVTQDGTTGWGESFGPPASSSHRARRTAPIFSATTPWQRNALAAPLQHVSGPRAERPRHHRALRRGYRAVGLKGRISTRRCTADGRPLAARGPGLCHRHVPTRRATRSTTSCARSGIRARGLPGRQTQDRLRRRRGRAADPRRARGDRAEVGLMLDANHGYDAWRRSRSAAGSRRWTSAGSRSRSCRTS